MKRLSALTAVVCLLCGSFFGGQAPAAESKPRESRPKAKAKAKVDRPTVVGPSIKGNKATPIDRIKVVKDFQVELLYSVPGVEQG